MNRFKDWKYPIFDKNGWAYPSNDFSDDRYGWRCQYQEGLTLGKNVDIGCFSYINAKYGVKIGDNVQIGAHCAIYSDDTEDNIYGEIIIGENSLIGAYTLILPGSTIASNSKIKAKSIIKGDKYIRRI